MKPKYYFAYGSNLHLDQMMQRCKTAVPVVRATLINWRLTFRGVADVVPNKGYDVEGAVYRIEDRDEKALDGYEGYPHLYIKRYVKVITEFGTEMTVMMYVMNHKHARSWSEYVPGKRYYNIIKEGYEHWKIEHDDLKRAAMRVLELT